MEHLNQLSFSVCGSNDKESVDYDFYWKLIKHYMVEVFDRPQFAIPYFIGVSQPGGSHVQVAMCAKFDLGQINYTQVIDELYRIETTPGFIGFQSW